MDESRAVATPAVRACAQQLAEGSDLLDHLARDALSAMGANRSVSLGRQALAVLPRPLASRCLSQWIQDHTGSTPLRQQLDQALRRPNHANATLWLGQGWRLRWRGGCIHPGRGNPEGKRFSASHGPPPAPATPE